MIPADTSIPVQHLWCVRVLVTSADVLIWYQYNTRIPARYWCIVWYILPNHRSRQITNANNTRHLVAFIRLHNRPPVRSSFVGLDGYDATLTWWRSRVRAPVEVIFFFKNIFLMILLPRDVPGTKSIPGTRYTTVYSYSNQKAHNTTGTAATQDTTTNHRTLGNPLYIRTRTFSEKQAVQAGFLII